MDSEIDVFGHMGAYWQQSQATLVGGARLYGCGSGGDGALRLSLLRHRDC